MVDVFLGVKKQHVVFFDIECLRKPIGLPIKRLKAYFG